MSDDGRSALTIIVFIGSVFSPYYAAARRWGRGEPEDFCAVNVALYEPQRHYWAMTERPRGDLARSAREIQVGPSQMRCTNDGLEIAVNERGMPVPRRIEGSVRITPIITNERIMALDSAGRHRWRPIAPHARIEVNFASPRVCWTGTAYVDTNVGEEPLENAFASWDWARIHTAEGTTILYDVARRDGTTASTASTFATDGTFSTPTLPPLRALPRTRWVVPRNIRATNESKPSIICTLEDTPFYARSLVATDLGFGPVTAMHESLCLRRVANPVVRFMLPFRMPRWRHGQQN